MLPDEDHVTDDRWQAILTNDAAQDGQFWYAVKTTGIFCRPSCKSRPPNRDNIRIFHTAEQALAARFRPCKRCKPTGERLPDEEWLAVVTEYIDRNLDKDLTLSALASVCHGSPYHLHRTFRKVKGVTPVEYVQGKRMEKARKLLADPKLTVAEVGRSVGLPNPPYFITLFKQRTGLTPARYRETNTNVQGGVSP
ncbi:bifunctional transcriptional activator/DNA repair enzyme AdaA [Cohnella boryungensis]|uniref:Bifunctional transcriptional activator/DNA repair enzyme AdaA n=1 Tax=Cohnella boryungensis TaxID=768479 RepID=A0ABV8SA01_9BACL